MVFCDTFCTRAGGARELCFSGVCQDVYQNCAQTPTRPRTGQYMNTTTSARTEITHQNIDSCERAGTLVVMISPEKLAKYRAAMEKERERLLADLKKAETPEDFGDDVDDIDSIEAEEATDLGNKLAIGQALRDRIAEIDEALLKIEKGEPLTEEYLDKVSGIRAS